MKPRQLGKEKKLRAARFSLATNRYVYNSKQVSVDYHDILCLGQRADFILKYGKVGQLLGIVGRNHSSVWKTKEGKSTYRKEVVAEEIIPLSPIKKAGTDKTDKKAEDKPGKK